MIYELQFEAQSPIHIGYKKIGTLKTTRYYIPGKAMWGALTAHITRSLYENPFANHNNYYNDVGKFIKTSIKTTYFFPKVNDTTYYPHYTEDGLRYGGLSKSEFERDFIYSRVGTAIDTTGTAEDRSLHETEYIRDTVTDDIKRVHWVGYCIVEEKEAHGLKITELNDKDFYIGTESDERKISFTDCILTLTVGGERNYGFGKLHFKCMKKSDNIFGFKISGDNNLISRIGLGHVKYEQDKDIEYCGDLEPVVGRDWSSNDNGHNGNKSNNKNKGTGQKSTFCDVCFVPGTSFNKDIKFQISEFGILDII